MSFTYKYAKYLVKVELNTGWIELKKDKSNLPPVGSKGIYEFSDDFNNPIFVICPGQSSNLRSRVSGMVKVLYGRSMNSGKDVVYPFIDKLCGKDIKMRYRVINNEIPLELIEDAWVEHRTGDKNKQIKFKNESLTYREFMTNKFIPVVKETFGEGNELMIAELGTDKGDIFKSCKRVKDKNELHLNKQLSRKAFKNIYDKILNNYYEEN